MHSILYGALIKALYIIIAVGIMIENPRRAVQKF